MKIEIHNKECLQALKKMKDNSIHSVVTDPPYGIGFMGKAWDIFKPGYAKDIADKDRNYLEQDGSIPRQASEAMKVGRYNLSSKAVKEYQDWCYLWALECLRILKPGGHLLASNSSRMYHRMAVAIEDAGFEIRDQIMWVYGSGFPKSLDISKAIDKQAGVEREVIGYSKWHSEGRKAKAARFDTTDLGEGDGKVDTVPKTLEAKQWDGWGTALKPAHEPIVVARKPLDGTVASNILKWGTGGINIDGCRIGTDGGRAHHTKKQDNTGVGWHPESTGEITEHGGRFPSNLIHDGSEEVEKIFPYTESGTILPHHKAKESENNCMSGKNYARTGKTSIGDSGSASRFFYCAKASKTERGYGLRSKDNNHPTVKPLELMRYLIRLVTPVNGICLDPFMGSGTTGMACKLEGFSFIGIEKEKEYCDIARGRIETISQVEIDKGELILPEKQPEGQGSLFET